MNLLDFIKNISICISEDERKSYVFETTWGWMFWWTIPLTFSWSDLVIILQSTQWQPNHGTKTHLESSRTGIKAVKWQRQNLKSNADCNIAVISEICSNTFSCPKSIPYVWSCTIYARLWRSKTSAIVYILSSSRLYFCLCPSLLCALHVCKCLPVVWLGRYFWHEWRCLVWHWQYLQGYNKLSHFYLDTFTLLFVMKHFNRCAALCC